MKIKTKYIVVGTILLTIAILLLLVVICFPFSNKEKEDYKPVDKVWGQEDEQSASPPSSVNENENDQEDVSDKVQYEQLEQAQNSDADDSAQDDGDFTPGLGQEGDGIVDEETENDDSLSGLKQEKDNSYKYGPIR